MSAAKILYVATEIEPFVRNSSLAKLVRTLAPSLPPQEFEVRIMVPCFGLINQRTNSIHEVLRLSGVNIALGAEQYSLLVKVASIREAKLQVYFIDNEDLFDRKSTIRNKKGLFYPDNHLRSIFFCKAVLATLRRQEWGPDIIHCHGWFTAFVPLYLKTAYKNSPLFKNTKCIYTFYQDAFPERLPQEDIVKQVKLREVHEEHLAPIKEEVSFPTLMQLAAKYADFTTRTFEKDPAYNSAWLAAIKNEYIAPDEAMNHVYLERYRQLLTSADQGNG